MSVEGPLHKIPIFRDLNDVQMEQVRAICFLISGEAGHCMLEQGQPVEDIYFFISGKAAIIKHSEDGHSMVIGYVGPGAILGEIALLDDGKASARIEATTPFKALKVDRTEFKQTMEANPELGYKIVSKIAWVAGLCLRLTSGKLAQYMGLPFLTPLDWEAEGS